tara:strand:- start:64 stop:174 length:111 start_codon:yes stop_codon:yes gene_type:complete
VTFSIKKIFFYFNIEIFISALRMLSAACVWQSISPR